MNIDGVKIREELAMLFFSSKNRRRFGVSMTK